jgi:hypothetical protein
VPFRPSPEYYAGFRGLQGPAYSSPDTYLTGRFGTPSYQAASALSGTPSGYSASGGLFNPKVGPLNEKYGPEDFAMKLPAGVAYSQQQLADQLRMTLANIGAGRKEAKSEAELDRERWKVDRPKALEQMLIAHAQMGGTPGSGPSRQGQQDVRGEYGRFFQDIGIKLAETLAKLSLYEQGAYQDYNAGMTGSYIDAANQMAAGGPAGGWGAMGFGQAGAPYAKALYEQLSGQFLGLSNMGIWVPKNIRGTNQMSTHALGNAVDVGVPNEKTGMAVYNWLKANQNAWGIKTILYDPAGAPGLNPGDHDEHIHIDWGYNPWAGWAPGLGMKGSAGFSGGPTASPTFGPPPAATFGASPSAGAPPAKKKKPVGVGGGQTFRIQ